MTTASAPATPTHVVTAAVLFNSAKFESYVCGQNVNLIPHLRAILKTKNDNKEIMDGMITALKTDIETKISNANLIPSNNNNTRLVISVGVSLGNPMKDTASVITSANTIIVKFIMDPLPIDCKQRTFIAVSIHKHIRKELFRLLYKYEFAVPKNTNTKKSKSNSNTNAKLNVSAAKANTNSAQPMADTSTENCDNNNSSGQ